MYSRANPSRNSISSFVSGRFIVFSPRQLASLQRIRPRRAVDTLLQLDERNCQPGAAPTTLGSNPPEHLVQFEKHFLVLRQGT
jgi:hypothetical protein